MQPFLHVYVYVYKLLRYVLLLAFDGLEEFLRVNVQLC